MAAKKGAVLAGKKGPRQQVRTIPVALRQPLSFNPCGRAGSHHLRNTASSQEESFNLVAKARRRRHSFPWWSRQSGPIARRH
jgi:hypothetical protein